MCVPGHSWVNHDSVPEFKVKPYQLGFDVVAGVVTSGVVTSGVVVGTDSSTLHLRALKSRKLGHKLSHELWRLKFSGFFLHLKYHPIFSSALSDGNGFFGHYMKRYIYQTT